MSDTLKLRAEQTLVNILLTKPTLWDFKPMPQAVDLADCRASDGTVLRPTPRIVCVCAQGKMIASPGKNADASTVPRRIAAEIQFWWTATQPDQTAPGLDDATADAIEAIEAEQVKGNIGIIFEGENLNVNGDQWKRILKFTLIGA